MERLSGPRPATFRSWPDAALCFSRSYEPRFEMPQSSPQPNGNWYLAATRAER